MTQPLNLRSPAEFKHAEAVLALRLNQKDLNERQECTLRGMLIAIEWGMKRGGKALEKLLNDTQIIPSLDAINRTRT